MKTILFLIVLEAGKSDIKVSAFGEYLLVMSSHGRRQKGKRESLLYSKLTLERRTLIHF
jgi:hypothetical protein